MSDWTGNKNSISGALGVSSDPNHIREANDYYATEPKAVELLLQLEKFDNNIWECACGEGHISNILEQNGHNVRSTDLINRNFGKGQYCIDFLLETQKFDGDIITNPPYKFAKEFVEKALELIPEGKRVAMFLKLTFLEGKERKKFFAINPPKIVYVSSSRLKCAMNGDFKSITSSQAAYAWFIWEKGYQGETILRWFN